VSARARTYLVVALAAVAAAAVVVATVAFTRTSTGVGGSPHAQTTPTVRGRAPVLALDLGVRTDPEAMALRHANRLYEGGKRAAAGRIFARYQSLPARVGAALAAWPRRSLARLAGLAREHPSSALVLLHLGLAQLAVGQTKAAAASWRRALGREPDTQSAVHADELLHPNFAPGLPPFLPSFTAPAAISRRSPPRQVAALRRAAGAGGVRARLLYGVALQRLGRPVSAEREFATAARLAPDDPEALTAADVGLFSKANPARAFSRLGPLARRFPRAQTVHFHLGVMLLWLRDVREARRQLRLARVEGPKTRLGRTATAFLKQLHAIRTK
jgi:Flp pilus assembly protein TadD